MHQGLLDRLLLTKDRIAQMAEGLIQIAGLEDPIGEVLSMKKTPERTADRSETCSAWRGWHYLRIQTECDGRCLLTLL